MRFFILLLFISLSVLSQLQHDTMVSAQELRVNLGEPDAEADPPFTRLTWVREMPDGSVIAADPVERTVVHLSVDLSERRVIGRAGQGPREYTGPTVALPWPGDSTVVFDARQSRYLVLDPDADPVRTFGLGQAAGVVSTQTPRVIDEEGRIYLRELDGGNVMMGFGFDPERPRLFRVDPGLGTAEAVGTLSIARAQDRPVGEPVRNEHGMTQMLIRIPQPWAGSESWGVDRNGRVGLIRMGTRPGIEWEDGEVTPLELAQRPVESGDRTRYVEAWRRSETRNGEPEEFLDQVTEDDLTWPDRKPVFSSTFAPTDSRGRLWLRLTDIEVERTSYGLVDPDRGLLYELRLPARTRLVGFGDGTVYLAYVDDFDQEWLRRYVLP